MSDLYAVFGNPIKQSRSPQLHQAFARQSNDTLRYETRQPALDGFADGWRAFLEEGGIGGNVTVPFKADALTLADVVSDRAQRAGAVNTLMIGKDGKLYGDNTDGVGLVRDLARLGIALDGKRVLLLGAGGAVRGVLAPLLEASPAALMIANRTEEKAFALIEPFADLGTVTAGGYEHIEGHWDVIINGTSASLSGNVPTLPSEAVDTTTCAYDMVYSVEPTPFMNWAAEHGARTEDGLGMLIEQAAEAYMLWRNRRPDTAPIHAMLRAELNASTA